MSASRVGACLGPTPCSLFFAGQATGSHTRPNTMPAFRTPAPRRRTTIALSGSTQAVKAHLCASSTVALQWAQAWAQRRDASQATAGRKVPISGVIRRALALYARHLQAAPDPAAELRALHSACTALRPSRADLEAQEERLTEALATGDLGQVLPPLEWALHGPGRSPEWADDMTSRAEALALQMQAEPAFRLAVAAQRKADRRQGVRAQQPTAPRSPSE